jgi:tRNA pseudouridine38-40 synthase
MQQTDSVQKDSTHSKNNNHNEYANRGNEPSMTTENSSNRGPSQAPKRKNERNYEKSRKSSRNWGGARRRERNVDSRPETEDGEIEKEERKPKKKVACFIGYSGEGYHGMQ